MYILTNESLCLFFICQDHHQLVHRMLSSRKSHGHWIWNLYILVGKLYILVDKLYILKDKFCRLVENFHHWIQSTNRSCQWRRSLFFIYISFNRLLWKAAVPNFKVPVQNLFWQKKDIDRNRMRHSSSLRAGDSANVLKKFWQLLGFVVVLDITIISNAEWCSKKRC